MDEAELFEPVKAQRSAAKRSAEVSTSQLRQAETDMAEKTVIGVAGVPGPGGGEAAPQGGGSPSGTASGSPILPTIETGEKSVHAAMASRVTNTAKLQWMPTLQSTSFGSSSISDKSFSIVTDKSIVSSKALKKHTNLMLLHLQALNLSLCLIL